MPQDSGSPESFGAIEGSPFSKVPLEIKISVGHARPMIRDLIGMTHDSVLPLDRRIDDPVELFVGDRLIARGALEEMEGEENSGKLAVRLIEIVRGGDELS